MTSVKTRSEGDVTVVTLARPEVRNALTGGEMLDECREGVERIAAIVREEFNVPWLRLTLNKPGALRGSKSVGVIIERGEKPRQG